MKEPAQKVVLNKKSDNTIADPEEFRSELEKRIGNLVSSAQKEKILEQLKPLVLMQAEMHAEMFSGPFPHPKHVKEYEECLPGCFDRMLTMAEKSQNSQIENNKKIIDHQINDSKRGMRYGLVALILIIVAATVCAVTNHDWVAGGFLGVGMIGVVGRFIMGRHYKTTKK